MKTIHSVTIVDRSTSMLPQKSRTIEGINGNINALKAEVDENTRILNTQLQFRAESGNYGRFSSTTAGETDFVFVRVGVPVQDLTDMTDADYVPSGGTPLLDAVGKAIEKVKEFHKDDLGSDDLKIIVTIFTDGEENSSRDYDKDDIKQMTEHLQSDGKWTFTFVGCGSLENVTATSHTLGISSANTQAYVATDAGYTDGFDKVATSYTNFARSVKMGLVDDDLFTKKAYPRDGLLAQPK